MNFYVVPFRVIPLRYNTLVPAFFPILEALPICKKLQGAKSGEYGGWGMITMFFLVKKLRTSNDK